MRTLFCFMLWAGSLAGQTASTANKPVCQLTTTEIKQGYCCARGGVQQDCPTILFERDIVRESAHKPEPIDVPAVAGKWTDGGVNDGHCASASVWPNIETSTYDNLQRCRNRAWRCTDKTRILQHDEQTPPKFWCHKPQVD